MSWLEEYENCLTLWLPDDKDTAIGKIPSLHRCNAALQDLMEQRISFQDYLDILQTEHIDMDRYIESSLDNVESNILK